MHMLLASGKSLTDLMKSCKISEKGRRMAVLLATEWSPRPRRTGHNCTMNRSMRALGRSTDTEHRGHMTLVLILSTPM